MITNTYEKARKMYDFLKEKGEVSLEDIVIQFGVSMSTAYNILRILRAMCENDQSCEEVVRGRKKVLVYKKKAENKENQGNQQQIVNERLLQ